MSNPKSTNQEPDDANFSNPIKELPPRHELASDVTFRGIRLRRCRCGLSLLTPPGDVEHWVKFDGEVWPVKDTAKLSRILAIPCRLVDGEYRGDDPEEAEREPEKDRAGNPINSSFFCEDPDLHDEYRDHYYPEFADELNFVEEKMELKLRAFDEGYRAAIDEVRTALYNGKCPIHGELFRSCGKCKQIDEYRRR